MSGEEIDWAIGPFVAAFAASCGAGLQRQLVEQMWPLLRDQSAQRVVDVDRAQALDVRADRPKLGVGQIAT